MSEPGYFTIFSGPPASGKTTESRRQQLDESYPFFLRYTGHNEESIVQRILSSLDQGFNVIYETTHTPHQIAKDLMDRVDTIEIFRRKD